MQQEPRSCGTQHRRRGRPVQIPQDARAEIVLATTTRLLSEKALDDVTMATIAREAGMSKRTIYELFDNREDLLSVCIGRLSQSFFLPLGPEDMEKPLKERLRRLLTINSLHGFDPSSVELLRTIIAKAHTYPTLAQNLFDDGFCGLSRMVAEELRIALEAEEVTLSSDRIDEASDMLVQMALENPMRRLLIIDTPPPEPNEIANRRDNAIDLFLSGAACTAA